MALSIRRVQVNVLPLVRNMVHSRLRFTKHIIKVYFHLNSSPLPIKFQLKVWKLSAYPFHQPCTHFSIAVIFDIAIGARYITCCPSLFRFEAPSALVAAELLALTRTSIYPCHQFNPAP